MKTSFILFVFTCIFLTTGFAQTPGLQWRHSFGGAQNDFTEFSFKVEDENFILVSQQGTANGDILIQKFTGGGTLLWKKLISGNNADQAIGYVVNDDGSFVILANTTSTSGDITGNHGGFDVLVFKMSANGQILWQKCLGGSQGDAGRAMIKNGANEYILVNTTRSNDGDVTGYRGDRDLWVVKLADDGNIVWKQCFGGSGTDFVAGASVIQAADNTFWIATESTSVDGNITANNGQADIWLLNVNAAGSLLTQKTFGGAGNEYATAVRQVSDGKIFVLGSTRSISLPNYHNYGSVYNNNGDYTDNYVVCLNSNGNMIWQKCFGGNLDDEPQSMITDGINDVIIAGDVNGGGGDVASTRGNTDIWLAKVNSSGNIVWQKTLGGADADGITGGLAGNGIPYAGALQRSLDGGLLISSYTTSRNTGDVTGYHLPPNAFDTAQFDIWIVKLNAAGTLQWAKALGGRWADYVRGQLIELSASEMIVTGHSTSSDGDVPANRGGSDIWIAKLGSINTIKGTVFFDDNSNGTKEAGEKWANGIIVTAQKQSDTRAAVTNNGYFKIEVDTGSHQITAASPSPYYTVAPASYAKTYTNYFNQDSIWFALQPVPNKRDLAVCLIAITPSRPGFATTYRIFYKNVGTVVASGEVLFKRDSRLNFVSASPAATSSTADTLKWSYNNLAPGDTASILLQFTVSAPPTVNVGDSLRSVAVITPLAGDETPIDNTSVLKQLVVGSFDPNDKAESNGGIIRPEQATDGSYLNYLIRFQNTGTDMAYTVVVRDTLDAKVDLSSMEMIAASHPYTLSIEDGDKLAWTFDNIRLPHAAANEPASHGYIVYRIRPKATVAAGDTIHNTASIYFDYNLPVLTNDAFTKVQNNITLPLRLMSFTGTYLANTGLLKWTTQGEYDFEKFVIERSTDGTVFSSIGTALPAGYQSAMNSYNFNDDLRLISQTKIYYRLKIVNQNGSVNYSNIILVKKTNAKASLLVAPNPVSDRIAVNLFVSASGAGQLLLINASGKKVWAKSCHLNKGENTIAIDDLPWLAKGIYYLRLIKDNETVTSPVLISK